MREYDKIKELIISNQFLETINKLSKIDKEGVYRIALININGRYESLENKNINGTLTPNETTAEENKLRRDLFKILEKISNQAEEKDATSPEEVLNESNDSPGKISTDNKPDKRSDRLIVTKTILGIITGLLVIGTFGYKVYEYYSSKELTIFLKGSNENIQYSAKKDTLEFYSPKSKVKLKGSISAEGRVDYLLPSDATRDKFQLSLNKEGYKIYPADSSYEFSSKSLWVNIQKEVDSTIAEGTSEDLIPVVHRPMPESSPPTEINPTISKPKQDSVEESLLGETTLLIDTVEKKNETTSPVYYELTIISSKKMGEIYIDGDLKDSQGGYADTRDLIKGEHHIIIKNTGGEIIRNAKIDLQKDTTIDLD